jgi:hypothetical protein
MFQFPRVQQLIRDGTFGEGHSAAGLQLSDPIVPALEYFLSLEQVPGFPEKKHQDLKLKPVGPDTTNARTVQWASLCAELGGIYLLGKTLGLATLGFDQHSPRGRRANSNCDVLVNVNGRHVYVEIKRKAAEDKQSLPKRLEDGLFHLQHKLPYGISVMLRDRDYDCSDLDLRLAAVEDHVERFQQLKAEGVWAEEETPAPLGGPFIIFFHDKSDEPPGRVSEHVIVDRVTGRAVFDPECTDNLTPYLVGPARIGRDGERMVPMVEQAIEKGADYLLCRVSSGDGWPEIVEQCFGHVTYTTNRTCFAADESLRGLRGVVLFSRYDDFCIVNNSSVEAEACLVA